jgi:hypothetical protein
MAVKIRHYYMACDTYWVEDEDAIQGAVHKIENSEKETYLIREETSMNEYFVYLGELDRGTRLPENEREYYPNVTNEY